VGPLWLSRLSIHPAIVLVVVAVVIMRLIVQPIINGALCKCPVPTVMNLLITPILLILRIGKPLIVCLGMYRLGYFRWWLQRSQAKAELLPDNKYADMVEYVLEPNSVYDSLTYVPTNSPTPTFTPIPTAIPATVTPPQ
jgi:hypothetical protein